MVVVGNVCRRRFCTDLHHQQASRLGLNRITMVCISTPLVSELAVNFLHKGCILPLPRLSF